MKVGDQFPDVSQADQAAEAMLWLEAGRALKVGAEIRGMRASSK